MYTYERFAHAAARAKAPPPQGKAYPAPAVAAKTASFQLDRAEPIDPLKEPLKGTLHTCMYTYIYIYIYERCCEPASRKAAVT